jgi:hypothetical protein
LITLGAIDKLLWIHEVALSDFESSKAVYEVLPLTHSEIDVRVSFWFSTMADRAKEWPNFIAQLFGFLPAYLGLINE